MSDGCVVFIDTLGESAPLDLLHLVSDCHEAGKEPGISKDLSAIDTTGCSPKSYWKGMEQLQKFTFSCRENRQKPKHERMVDANN